MLNILKIILNKTNNQINKLITTIYFNLLLPFTKPAKQSEKSILILKPDGIGDYILIRSLLLSLKEASKLKYYNFYFCGNKAYEDLFANIDSQYFKGSYWINRQKFLFNGLYRLRKLLSLRRRHYDIVIYPVKSREYLLGDLLIKNFSASQKVGIESDLQNINLNNKKKGDKFYNLLIRTPEDLTFEWDIISSFFSKYFSEDIKVQQQPAFPEVKKCNQITLFVGGGHPKRCWPESKYIELIKSISVPIDWKIIITGEKSDINYKEIIPNKDILDLVGQTSLIELNKIIAQSSLLISNESCSVHMAAAESTTTLCVSNGNHYYRFHPYPQRDRIIYCYPPIMEEQILRNNTEAINKLHAGSNLLIESISVEQVIKKVKSLEVF